MPPVQKFPVQFFKKNPELKLTYINKIVSLSL